MTPKTPSLSRRRPSRDRAGRRGGDPEESAADLRCLRALRDGDDSAFTRLVARHHGQMVRVARCYVGCPAAAHEATQEAWAAALHALDGVDDRTSPRLWLFRILTSAAVLRARREGPAARPAGEAAPGPVPGMDAGGRWSSQPALWGAADLRRLGELAAQGAIDDMIAELPLGERLVVTLRDVCRWEADEVAHLLAVSPADQRTLLHAARRRIHAALAARLRPDRRPTRSPGPTSREDAHA